MKTIAKGKLKQRGNANGNKGGNENDSKGDNENDNKRCNETIVKG